MVKQTRQIFDLADVKAIRFRCNHCNSSVVQSDYIKNTLEICPLCGEGWRPTNERSPTWRLVRAMRDILNSDSPPMTVEFEIESEDK